jgi:S-DNA-T family DNA segregation ATPase FtsK/SpoIIIE
VRTAPPKPRPIKPQPRPEHLPPLDLLVRDSGKPGETADLQLKKRIIEQTLASFGVPVEVVDISVGPTVTQFGVKPGITTRRSPDGQDYQRRVRVSRIKALSNDLALALEAPSIRIEAPVPGKGYVGIEVPNQASDRVTLRAVLESQEFLRIKAPLAIALGRDVSGTPVAADLNAMPHLLIAGATGSGKSVCIHSILSSLLFNNGPDVLRLLLVDPKRVELPDYNGVPHLVAPVVTDADQVVGALTWLTLQMDERYRAFARVGARSLKDYNRKVDRKGRPAEWRDLEPYPYIVFVIDELADLMHMAPDKVEYYICRLAQMARATGIHLVLATQRPSVDVVTGLIKANFPARIAFSVTSQMDSRVILDTPGAEKLLGRGDMLFMRPDSAKLDRLQGCFVSDKEIAALVRFWREAMPAEPLPPNAPRFPWTGLLAEMGDQDELYDKALELVQGQARVSTSWLQRRLKVSYHRAAELIERMEADGYVGADEGAGRGREVLIASGADESDDWLT